MIRLKNIQKTFQGQILFRIEGLEIAQGNKVWIKGPTGIGKSTLFKIISGIMSPDLVYTTPTTTENSPVTIIVNNQDILKLTSTDRDSFRAANLSIIFQEFNMLPALNVLENLLVHSQFKKDLIKAKV